MARKYKLSEGLTDKFWQLFSQKQTPKPLQNVIDSDPVLLRLQGEMSDINDSAEEYLRKLKITDPAIYNWLKKRNLAP